MTDPESIFEAALQVKGAKERQAFLMSACGNDATMREEISSLLKAADAAGSFLDTPLGERLDSEPERARDKPTRGNLDPSHAYPTIGNYEIRGRLGEGGMGTVYRARHLKLNKEVALKVLRIRANADQNLAVARFEQELQATGSIDHPNIVRAFDAGELDGAVYLSMELLEGIDLHHAVTANEKLSVADACEVGRQSAQGLQFAHDHGLVHRDVKPSNLMLTVDVANQASIKLLDLGLALVQDHQTDERLTDEGVTMGTFLYMAPEQAIDTKTVDHRADIYSLGATLFRLITGKPPFLDTDAESPAKILLALTTRSAPSLGDMNQDVPPAIVDLVNRMLARDPADRPQDLHEVVRILEPVSQLHQLANVLSTGLRSYAKDQTTDLNALKAEVSGLLGHSKPALEQASDSEQDFPRDEAAVLRQRVKKFWVDGVLARTEENETLVALKRELRPDAVINPWEGVTEVPLNSSDAQRPIEEIFEDSDRSLLILGQPGAGKSVSLLQLTRKLLTQRSSTEPIVPVVLHLSTWSNNSLTEWIENEISAKYQVPRNIGRTLIEDNRLLLVLDGLDEVRKESQADCVAEINRFLDNQVPPGIVVSCRFEDYKAIGLRLKFHGAVLLKPLTAHQIEKILTQGRASASPLLDSLQKHDSVMELAKSPLMLSVMKLSFSDASEETMKRFETLERNPERMFQTFVDRMFQTKGKTEHGYSKSQTLQWLSWLAARMNERNQSVLLIEQLQPSWFQSRSQQILYSIILCVGVGLATAIPTMFAWKNAIEIMDFGASTAPYSLFWLIVQIPIWMMMIAVVDFRFFRAPTIKPGKRANRSLQIIAKTIGYWSLWMLWPLVGWLTGAWSSGWIIADVLIGLMLGPLLSVQVKGQRVIADIETAEALGISAVGSLKGWLWGLIVGYGIYQAYLWLWALYLLDQPPDWFPYYWKNEEEVFVSISWPFIAGACGIVIGALTPKVTDGNTVPNQGMKMSLRNAVVAGAYSTVALAIAIMLSIQFWLKLPSNSLAPSMLKQLEIAGATAVWVGFLVALIFGGMDFIKHWLTRRILIAARLIPQDLVDFLEHTVRLSFVKRAGGAYLFNHQLLLKYFASRSDQD